MAFLFYGCSRLLSLDLSNFNTKNVKDMSYMFFGCTSINELYIKTFDTSNVQKTIRIRRKKEKR